jgi:peptidoglycan/xylan/chitin deacetylase (PgdA/CDA1 family)
MNGLTLIVLLLVFFGAGSCSSEKEPEDAADDAAHPFTVVHGGVIRGDTSKKEIALVFTGDQYAEGGEPIRAVLARHGIEASFFLTGNFYRNEGFAALIRALKADGHYLGAHSDRHLLYCSWEDRDSLLITKSAFVDDLDGNYAEMARFGIRREEAAYFMPPYEWYNARISAWTAEQGLTLVNFTPGTRSNADYTTPDMGARYVPGDAILQSILTVERDAPDGLNGFILLTHIGVAPERTDKFYSHLDQLLSALLEKGYRFKRIDALLEG